MCCWLNASLSQTSLCKKKPLGEQNNKHQQVSHAITHCLLQQLNIMLIHKPFFISDCGYLASLILTDYFLLYDVAQMSKKTDPKKMFFGRWCSIINPTHQGTCHLQLNDFCLPGFPVQAAHATVCFLLWLKCVFSSLICSSNCSFCKNNSLCKDNLLFFTSTHFL